MNIQQVIEIAQAVERTPDDRPEWLQRCRDTDQRFAMYYKFLYQLAKAMQPRWVLETGTRLGLSAVQLAAGAPAATVITIDIDPQSQGRVKGVSEPNKVSNILPITSDSRKVIPLLPPECQKFDLIYLDSDHTYDVVMPEFRLFQPLLRPGGVMVFDDITLNAQMRKFWSEVPGPKAELNDLHRLCGAGFGAYAKPE